MNDFRVMPFDGDHVVQHADVLLKLESSCSTWGRGRVKRLRLDVKFYIRCIM